MKQNFNVTNITRVILAGKEVFSQRKTNFTNHLHSCELIYHFSGKSTVYFNNQVLIVEENTIRFLPKGYPDKYIVERVPPGECIDIFFDTDVLISDEAFVMKLINNTNVKNMFKKIFILWVSKKNGYYLECMSLLYKIFAEIQKQDYIPQNQYEIIRPAIKHIEENFLNNKISVPFLADLCKISESYLKTLFNKKLNMSPSKYIIHLKMNYAQDLLCSEEYSISQIAEICGYDSIYYFSRQFKIQVGVSPSEFIKQYKSY